MSTPPDVGPSCGLTEAIDGPRIGKMKEFDCWRFTVTVTTIEVPLEAGTLKHALELFIVEAAILAPPQFNITSDTLKPKLEPKTVKIVAKNIRKQFLTRNTQCTLFGWDNFAYSWSIIGKSH